MKVPNGEKWWKMPTILLFGWPYALGGNSLASQYQRQSRRRLVLAVILALTVVKAWLKS